MNHCLFWGIIEVSCWLHPSGEPHQVGQPSAYMEGVGRKPTRWMSKGKVVMRSKLMSCKLRVQSKQKFIIVFRIPLGSGARHRLRDVWNETKTFYLDIKAKGEHRELKVWGIHTQICGVQLWSKCGWFGKLWKLGFGQRNKYIIWLKFCWILIGFLLL